MVNQPKWTGSNVASNVFDILIVQESKIGTETGDNFINKLNYNIIRRDRHHFAGENLIFLKNNYKIIISDEVFETIILTISIHKTRIIFLVSYNPHYEYTKDFLFHLGSNLLKLNLMNPTFVVGDLNNDLLCSKGIRLCEALSNLNFKNYVKQATHIQGKASTLIDVVF